MKKIILRTKLALQKETIKALVMRDLAVAGAGKDGPGDSGPLYTCPAAVDTEPGLKK
jgi:hypothetical protein